jgi:hypothetical protein
MRGVPTDAIAGMVWAGETPGVVADEFGLPGRMWVLVACWYEARHGQPRTAYRRAWKQWAERAGKAMWASSVNYAAIPDPPSRDKINQRETATTTPTTPTWWR